MGIQGLLPLLKSIHKPTHLRNFAGQTLGVDAYGWLHRGTVACAIELAQGKPTRKHIDFAMSRVRMLIHFGVKPYIVFDGDYLPSKAHTEKERAERRKESRRLGLELLSKNKAPLAQLELQKAVDVTASMARELIEELKGAGVPYVVAPYEADSQLAYLEQQGIIDGILSEDSDLLVFGAKCLLTKLDQYGECVMINRADFTACREVSLIGWSDKEFRIMAMLSGCDYLPGIDKMGLKTAYRLVRKHKTVDRIVRTVQFDGKMKVPANYLEAFQNAERTFLYQWVFCPEAQALVNLNAVPSDIDMNDMPYLGSAVEASVALGVAKGDLDPNTKLPLSFNRHSHQHQPYRSTIFSTPDLKQGKPITEFFRRTPLAELDPNSFTPSPSQARLQQNNRNNSWSASQIPAGRRPISTRVSTGHTTPASAPQPVRRTVSAAPNFAVASPKRQRLCSNSSLQDLAVAVPNDGSAASTSRFFSKQPAQGSPSVRKASKQRDEFEILSDDSIAEAAVAAAEAAEASQRSQEQSQSQSQDQSQHDEIELTARKKAEKAGLNLHLTRNETSRIGARWDSFDSMMSKKRKKIEVFVDKEVKRERQREREKEASQSTVATFGPSQETTTTGVETPSTSFETSQPQSQSQSQSQSQDEHNVFKKGIAGGLAHLKTYSYNNGPKPSPTPQRPQRRNGIVHPSLQSVSTAGIAQQARRRSTMARSPTRAPLTATPSEEQSPDADEERIPASSPLVAEPKQSLVGDSKKGLAVEQRPLRTRLSPGEAKGSEDFIVPESPSSDGDDEGAKSKMDFRQWAFAGS